MGKSKELRGLRAARKALKMTQETVALRAGLDRSRVCRYESGDRRMGREAAEALAPVLKSEPNTIMFENRRVMVERAMKNRDPEAVLKAATSAVKITGDEDLSPEGEEALDELVETALKFFESTASGGDDDGELYGVEEGRDPLGHRVSKKAAAESRQAAPYGPPGVALVTLQGSCPIPKSTTRPAWTAARRNAGSSSPAPLSYPADWKIPHYRERK